MRFDANGPTSLGPSRKLRWDSLQEPSVPAWLVKVTGGGATYTEQDPTTTGGGIVMKPAETPGAQAIYNMPALDISQFRAVRLRCIFTTNANPRGITLRLGETGDGRGARITKIPYVDEIKLGASAASGIKYLNSNLPRFQEYKTFDISLLIENTPRNIYTLQGEQVADYWPDANTYLNTTGTVVPGFAVSQHETVTADTRVTLREISLERWM
jgi:hypothetical protein